MQKQSCTNDVYSKRYTRPSNHAHGSNILEKKEHNYHYISPNGLKPKVKYSTNIEIDIYYNATARYIPKQKQIDLKSEKKRQR